MQISINEFSTHASALIADRVQAGLSLLITRRNKELVVAITPWSGEEDLEPDSRQVPMRELSRDTFNVFAAVRETNEPMTITKHGRPVGEIVPVSAEAERRFAARVAAQSADFAASLGRADADLAAGRATLLDDEFIAGLPEHGESRPQARRAQKRLRAVAR